MSSPRLQAFSQHFRDRFFRTRPLVATAVILGWTSLYLVSRGHWGGYTLAVVTSILTLITLRRGSELAERAKGRYRIADEAAEARSRELDRLANLAATLLKGTDIQALFHEIA